MYQIPQFFQFQDKFSYQLWALFNLYYVVLELNGHIDLINLYVVLFIGSVVAVKIMQFVLQSSEKINNKQEYIQSDRVKEVVIKMTQLYENVLNQVLEISTLKDYALKIGPIIAFGYLLNQICVCTLQFSTINGIFLWYFLTNQMNIDLNSKVDMLYGNVQSIKKSKAKNNL